MLGDMVLEGGFNGVVAVLKCKRGEMFININSVVW